MLIDTNEFVLDCYIACKLWGLDCDNCNSNSLSIYSIGKKWIQIMLGRLLVYLFDSLCLQL